MLLRRGLTALLGVPVVITAVWFGPPWITIMAAVAAIAGVREAYRLFALRFSDHDSDTSAALPLLLGGTWGVALVLAGEVAGSPQDFGVAAAAIILAGAIVGALWMIAMWRNDRAVAAAAWLSVTPVYIGGGLGCAVALRGMESESLWSSLAVTAENGIAATADEIGLWWLLMGILVVYAADTGAYTVGRLIGRHRMAPSISPGKTWEGAAGGMIASVVAGALLGRFTLLGLEVWQGVAIGVILGIVSPAGDLLESKLKRMADVKDSGNLFPGHGGMLDRIDSLLPSFIAVYVLAVYHSVAT